MTHDDCPVPHATYEAPPQSSRDFLPSGMAGGIALNAHMLHMVLYDIIPSRYLFPMIPSFDSHQKDSSYMHTPTIIPVHFRYYNGLSVLAKRLSRAHRTIFPISSNGRFLHEIRMLLPSFCRPSKSVLRVLRVLRCASCALLCFAPWAGPLTFCVLRLCFVCFACASRVLLRVLGQHEARASRASCASLCLVCFV